MKKDIKIMDVTLRDGSYANHFQFSLAQQKIITCELENLGVEFIEIGHGMGLGASSPKNGVSLHTDDEYLEMAQKTLKKAKYGMFCIPGISSLADLEKAAKFGCKFIRIGTNVTEVEKAEPFIKKAKELGLIAMSNLMKAYAVDCDYFAQQVKKAESYGADYVYLVDSAGCMLPSDVEKMFFSVRKISDVKLGFHGHDNIGLAMTNALKAAELGFDIIDTTLQGMGRSSGNTPTELFMICSNKIGYCKHYDIFKILNLSKKLIFPLVRKYNNIDITCGVVGMHTGFLGSIHKISGKYCVNPMVLMEKYSSLNKISMDINVLENIATELPEDLESYSIADFNGYFGHGQY